MSLKNLFGRKNKQESKNANTKKTTITDNNDVDSEKECGAEAPRSFGEAQDDRAKSVENEGAAQGAPRSFGCAQDDKVKSAGKECGAEAPRSFDCAQDDKGEEKDNTKVGVFADAKDFSTAATPSVEMTEEVGKKDNTEVGVFADAKDFSTNARNDGRRAVGTDVKKPLSQCSDTDSSPLGGGAEIEV